MRVHELVVVQFHPFSILLLPFPSSTDLRRRSNPIQNRRRARRRHRRRRRPLAPATTPFAPSSTTPPEVDAPSRLASLPLLAPPPLCSTSASSTPTSCHRVRAPRAPTVSRVSDTPTEIRSARTSTPPRARTPSDNSSTRLHRAPDGRTAPFTPRARDLFRPPERRLQLFQLLHPRVEVHLRTPQRARLMGVFRHDVPPVAQDRSDDVVGVEGVETSTGVLRGRRFSARAVDTARTRAPARPPRRRPTYRRRRRPSDRPPSRARARVDA